MSKPKIYPKGVFFRKKRKDAKDFVVGYINLQFDKFVEWGKDHVNENGFVNMDVLWSEEKKSCYTVLNSYDAQKILEKRGQ